MPPVDALLSIGDFSRMTYLSIKTLRHYHDVGVLEPARIDPVSGYRFYRPAQVATAQIIRRFRDLGMPLEEVRAILGAPDVGTRNRTIITHLERMERQLAQTQETVASLRTLLQGAPSEPAVTYRAEPATVALTVVATVGAAEAVEWWMAAFTDLHRALARAGARRAGPDGALFADEFFAQERGEVMAFVPVTGLPAAGLPVGLGRVVRHVVPAAELAVIEHSGPFRDLDRAYGELGLWVTERALAAPGPVRERYLPQGDPRDLLNHHTLVCWPVSGDAGTTWAGPNP